MTLNIQSQSTNKKHLKYTKQAQKLHSSAIKSVKKKFQHLLYWSFMYQSLKNGLFKGDYLQILPSWDETKEPNMTNIMRIINGQISSQ